MDEKMQRLDCRQIQVDEIWGFIEIKQKAAKRLGAGPETGDVWTWIAIDAETKVVPTFAVGDRTQSMANLKFHKTTRCTPAMAAGVTNSASTARDLVEMIEG